MAPPVGDDCHPAALAKTAPAMKRFIHIAPN